MGFLISNIIELSRFYLDFWTDGQLFQENYSHFGNPSKYFDHNKNTFTLLLTFSGVCRSFSQVMNEKLKDFMFHTSQIFTR
jgi:hypothetical protein